MSRRNSDTNATVSTGQAASLCGVESDTVLKWIKAGRIPATKTAGGHYRIEKERLHPFIPVRRDDPSAKSTELFSAICRKDHLRCWEFWARDGRIQDICLDCIAYKSKAEKCYILVKAGSRKRDMNVRCKQQCAECTYYDYVNSARSRVLVITHDDHLKERFRTIAGENSEIRFSCCGYNAAMLLGEFQPESVLIDDRIDEQDPHQLRRSLAANSRLTKTRIYFMSEEPESTPS